MFLNAVLVVVWPMIWGTGMYLSYYSVGYTFIVMWPLYEVCIVIGTILFGLACFLAYWILYFAVYLPGKHLSKNFRF